MSIYGISASQARAFVDALKAHFDEKGVQLRPSFSRAVMSSLCSCAMSATWDQLAQIAAIVVSERQVSDRAGV